MNAVNLIPLERRYSGIAAPGAPFLGVLAALLLALAGTVLYVGAHNDVATRQSELSQVEASAAQWSVAAARYTPSIAALSRRERQFAALGGLLGERYDWSVLLGQLAGVMPAHAELTSMSAATPSTLSGAAGAAPAAGAPSAAPGITIAGCATSQSVVADTMIALRRLSGVSAVNLSSSALQGDGGSAAAGAGSCTLPVSFSVSLQFTPTARTVTMPGTTKAPAPSTTTTTTTTGATASATASASGAATGASATGTGSAVGQ